MSEDDVVKILIEQLLFENSLNERLGTDTEGLNNTGVGPQSSSRMGIFDQPGPDPEKDTANLEKIEPSIISKSLVSVGSIVDEVPSEDQIFDDNYVPSNYQEMSNVASYLIRQLEDEKDINKSWNIITNALVKIKGK